jgi:polysaccharide pyruvyl transferase WcaK-like protein
MAESEINNSVSRRDALKSMSTLLLAGLTGACGYSHNQENNMTILLVSGWQDVNIGDIAHTPGLLHVLETYLPIANVILWKRSKSDEVEELLKKNFPKVEIIYGNVDDEKNVTNPEIIDAFHKADLMIHGSGPNIVGQAHLEAWVKNSNKPFGIFGVTIQNIDENRKLLLEKASFIYTRETASLEVLKSHGLTGKHISFAPDATFHFHLKDEFKAIGFLNDNDLEERKFICVIPRLRITPYYRINQSNWSESRIREVNELNEKFKEIDHAKLRHAMITWVRETKNKVLVCPEMTYQVDIMDELLIDPLPADVKPYVLKRGYWLPDEAASVYARAHTLLSFECHSPIIALAAGTPAMYLRQPEDTIKGQMYYDLGVSDWVFEINDTEGEQIANRLMDVYRRYDNAKGTAKSVIDRASDIYKNACASIGKQGNSPVA